MEAIPWALPYLLFSFVALCFHVGSYRPTRHETKTAHPGGINRHGILGFEIFVGANRYPVINYFHYFITTIFTSIGGPGTGFETGSNCTK
jgi:hypothetical protein